jgi:GDPmannose 4,6-dehydratase
MKKDFNGTGKVAFITGITGQDGAYLARYLLSLGYSVHGGVRRTSSSDFWRLDVLKVRNKIVLHDFEISEYECVSSVLREVKPHEVYNLAAQSFVGTSFNQPFSTTNINLIGTMNLLEALRIHLPEARLYHASTSEMFGLVQQVPQSEKTPFHPRSPYAVAKLAAHWMCINYRESYGLHVSLGILFNHESPLRGVEFVTRKITKGIAGFVAGVSGPIALGNLDAKRDWGFAGDYVEAMHAMVQQESSDEFVVATNQTHSIRDFIRYTSEAAGLDIVFEGAGMHEKVFCKKQNKPFIEVSDKFFRPAEVDLLIGNAEKARELLGWQPKVFAKELAKLMYESDFQSLR